MRIWVVTVNRAQFVVSEWAELMVVEGARIRRVMASGLLCTGSLDFTHIFLLWCAFMKRVDFHELCWFLFVACTWWMNCCHWSTNHHYPFSVYLGEFLLLFYLLITYIKLPLYFVFISLSYLYGENTKDSYLYISCIYYQLWISMDPEFLFFLLLLLIVI